MQVACCAMSCRHRSVPGLAASWDRYCGDYRLAVFDARASGSAMYEAARWAGDPIGDVMTVWGVSERGDELGLNGAHSWCAP
jgi:hypothetical protein